VFTETVTVCEVLPDPVTDSHGVPGEVEVVTEREVPELVICRVCGGGVPDGVVENVRLAALEFSTGPLATIKSTGTDTTAFAAPVDDTRTLPWYAPAVSWDGSIEICIDEGVVPPPTTVNQGAPGAVAAVYEIGVLVLLTSRETA
jgi:hypothetical protein